MKKPKALLHSLLSLFLIVFLMPGLYCNNTSFSSLKSIIVNNNTFSASKAIPTVTTTVINNVTNYSATTGGTIVSDGGFEITAKGIVYSRFPEPTVENNLSLINSGVGSESFTTALEYLTSGTTYYVRAFATNSSGTGYGSQLVFITTTTSGAVAPNGNGSETDPYLVENYENIIWMSENGGEWGKYFSQTADINASVTSTLNANQGHLPIGNTGLYFTGHYNGNGHAITNLYINRAEEMYIGFFGYISGGTIANVKIIDATIYGLYYCGLLSGYITGVSQVTKCCVNGNVNGSAYAGSFAGAITSSTIANSYGRGAVMAGYAVGGFAGNAESATFTNCYTTALIEASGDMGGFVGANSNSTETNCYYDTDACGIITSPLALGRTTAQMVYPYESSGITYIDWDFTDTWVHDESLAENNGYPVLKFIVPTLPQLLIEGACNYTNTSVTVKGKVISNGGLLFTSSGFVWATYPSPTLESCEGASTNPITNISLPYTINNLPNNTQYYLRAYATNNVGTGYSDELVFTTVDDSVLFYDDFNILTVDQPAIIPSWGNIDVLGSGVWVGKFFENNKYAQVSSYGLSDSGDNSIWLITPQINLDATENEVFSFDVNVGYFTHNGLSVLISFDYIGDVNTASWVDVTSDFTIPMEPTSGYSGFVPAGTLSLNEHAGNITIAFKYSGNSTNGQTTTYQVDNVLVKVGLASTVPTVRLPRVYNIKSNSAGLKSIIAFNGGSEITQQGFVYSTLANPTIENNEGATSELVSVGEFSSTITGLEPNTLYYVKAYAINSIGIAYSDETSFTTVDNTVLFYENFGLINQNEMINLENWFNMAQSGSVYWKGGLIDNNFYARAQSYGAPDETDNIIWLITPGVYLDTTQNETLSFDVLTGYYTHSGLQVFITNNYTGDYTTTTWDDITSSFDIPVEPVSSFGTFVNAGTANLSAYSGYVVVAFKYTGNVINNYTTTYGVDNVIIKSNTVITLPELTINQPADITEVSTSITGQITNNGGAEIINAGFVYATFSNPTLETNEGSITVEPQAQVLSATINNLLPNTTYYINAYATNTFGTAYSTGVSFTTLNNTTYSITSDENIAVDAFDNNIYVALNATVTANTLNSAMVQIVNYVPNSATLGIDGALSGVAGDISYNFNNANGILYLTGDASGEQYQNIIRQLTYNCTRLIPNYTNQTIVISLGSLLYNYQNGHFYEKVDEYVSTLQALTLAAERNYLGLTGYLVTITSAYENNLVNSIIDRNARIAAQDISYPEGNWCWIAGPENGTQFFQGYYNTGVPVNNNYSLWAVGEPSGNGGYVNINVNGQWDDNDNAEENFVVEYGGMASDPAYALAANINLNINVPLTNTFTVYYNNPDNWENVYIWLWDDIGSFMPNWPGAALTPPPAGSIWWSFEVPNNYSWFNFNNGGTDDYPALNRNTTGWYDGEKWYDTEPVIEPVKETPVIFKLPTDYTIGQGNIDWDKLPANYIDRGEGTINPETSTWKMAWTENNLYIQVVVDDDHYCNQWCTGHDNESWMGDRVEVYFNVSGDLNPPNSHGANNSDTSNYQLGYYQITSVFENGILQNSETALSNWTIGTNFFSAYNIVDNKIIVEYRIPYDCILANGKTYTPVAGNEFGFDVTFTDWDLAQSNGVAKWWNSNADGWIRINNIGKVVFSPQVITQIELPTVETGLVSNLTQTSASIAGNVIADGGAPVSAKGIVYGLQTNPTIDNNIGVTNNGDGIGSFIADIINLTPNTKYFARAYAKNQLGTAYGQEIELLTKPEYYTVNFNVDLNYEVNNNIFTKESDTLFVTGSFAKQINPLLGWDEPGKGNSLVLTDTDGDNIFTGIAQVDDSISRIEYKYFINSGWAGSEWAGGDNRAVDLNSTIVNINDIFATIYSNVIFDPAKVDAETLPEGQELVSIGNEIYIKVKLNGWQTFVNLPVNIIIPTDNYSFNGKIMFDPENSGYEPSQMQAYIAPTGIPNTGQIFTATLLPAPTVVTEFSAATITGFTIRRIEVAAQNSLDPQWAAITGGSMYIGKIVSKKYTSVNYAPRVSYLAMQTSAISVDGENTGNEWAMAIDINNKINQLAQTDGTHPTDVDDNSASFKAMWDKNNLYLFIDITDNLPVSALGSSQFWLNDGIEVYIDIKDRRYDINRIVLQQHLIGLNYGADQIRASAFGDYQPTWAIANTSKGYSIEIGLPWRGIVQGHYDILTDIEKFIADSIINAKKISFEISLFDADVYNQQQSILNWSNNSGRDVSNSTSQYYGQIILNDGSSSLPAIDAVTHTNITINSATLKANVNANNLTTNLVFQYGTTPDMDKSILPLPSQIDGAAYQSVSANLTGLTENTTYYYCLKAENSLGTNTSSTYSFTTNADGYSVSISGDTNVCLGQRGVTYTLVGEYSTVVWEVNNGAIVSGQNTGKIKVDWNDTGTGGSVSVTAVSANNKTANYLLTVNFNGTASYPKPTIRKKGSINILICSQQNANKYQWFKDGNEITGPDATKQFYLARQNLGKYYVGVGDNAGCWSYSDAYNITTTKSLSIYPNPTAQNATISIESDLTGTALIKIVDLFGKTIKQIELNKPDYELIEPLNVKNIEKGVYVIELIIDNQKIDSQRLIINY